VTPVDFPDPTRFFFAAPGGQVFRLAPIDGGLEAPQSLKNSGRICQLGLLLAKLATQLCFKEALS
jgi:hypothetical protein